MFPIVLAHGIARFDILRQLVHQELDLPPSELEDKLQYFKNIRGFLNDHGFPAVSNPNVEFAGSVRDRAAQLKIHVEKVLADNQAEKAHIIAHSMGGLDARVMIVELGMADRVASLTTIGTPHFGSPVADRLLGFGGGSLLKSLQETALHLDINGVNSLSSKACREFDEAARSAEATNGVFYQVYSSYEEFNDMFLPLLGTWAIIRAVEGRNDGLVSVTSQMWKPEIVADDGTRKPVVQREFPFRADHLNQCGWWDAQETSAFSFGENWIEAAKEYELNVKNVYLEIARSVQNIPQT